eukprot:558653-Amphidinium_carterae.2
MHEQGGCKEGHSKTDVSTQTTCHVVWGSIEPDSDESAQRSLEERGVDRDVQSKLQADAAHVLFLEESPESSAADNDIAGRANRRGDQDKSRCSWSYGSRQHSQGLCTPCVHFWKPKSCAQRQYCDFCHVCSHDELTTFLMMRKKLDKSRRREHRRHTRQQKHKKPTPPSREDNVAAEAD